MSSDELTAVAGTAARGGFFLFVGNAVSVVILAIGGIIIARLLGPSSYGLYVLATFTPVLLVSVADAGINYALVRTSAKLRAAGDHRGTARTIRLGLLFKLTVCVLVFLICYFGANQIAATLLNRPELAPLLRLASFMIVFQSIFDGVTNSFVGLDLMEYSAGMQVLYSILKSVLAPALILLGFGIAGAIGGYLTGVLIAGVTGAIILVTRHARSTDETSGPGITGLIDLLRYGFPLYLATLLGILLSQYQNIVLAHFSTNVQIGNFNAAWNFNSFFQILTYPITTAIFPMFSKMKPESQRDSLSRGFVLAVKYASLFVIPAAAVALLFSQDLISLTYGRSFTLAPHYLFFLSMLYLLTGIGYQIIGSFLMGAAETRAVLTMNAVTLSAYLPLGLAFTWLWGPYGLIAAYILSNMVSTLYGAHIASVKLTARLDIRASARIILAALLAAAPPLILLSLHVTRQGVAELIIGGSLYLVTYLTLAPLVQAIGLQDIENLENTMCRTRAMAALLGPVLSYEKRLLTMINEERTQ